MNSHEIALVQRHEDALEAFKILKDCCETNGVDYYLLAGSLLGAVRYGGIIPWDDDIDVGVKQDDYERIRTLLPIAYQGTRFQYVDRFTHRSFPRMFGKVLIDGCNCVDVFVLVKTSSNPDEKKKHWNEKRLLYALYKRKCGWKPTKDVPLGMRIRYRAKGLCIKPALLTLSQDGILEQLMRIERRYADAQNPKEFFNFYSIYSMDKETIRAEWLSNPQTIKFEGMDVQTVGDIESYLGNLYGDEYMTPPPEKLRFSKHLNDRLISQQ